jgi:hypothetical protein
MCLNVRRKHAAQARVNDVASSNTERSIPMTKICFALILALTCLACDHGVDPVRPIQIGDYVGTFSIRSENGTTLSGLVTFRFHAGTYSCIPEKVYLPPSGGGSYRISGNSLTFSDTVMHTAEFDWSLILNGDFTYSNDGNRITLTQNDIEHRRYRTIVLVLDR